MGAEATFSMFSSPKDRTLQAGLTLTEPEKGPEPLTEKYRPKLLRDVVGQSYAVMELSAYADMPYPHAMIFSGPPGTGKTSCAFALANELKVNRTWDFCHVKSGELDAEAVQNAIKMSRFHGVGGGYKMILCDEGDLMSRRAKDLWLSILEDIPHNTVIIFTTNDPDKFEQRFIERCLHLTFESNARVLRPDAQSYLNRLWIGEGLAGTPPNIEDCKGVLLQNVVSFRRIARFVESEMRKQSAKLAQNVVHAGNKISLAEHNTRKGVRL